MRNGDSPDAQVVVADQIEDMAHHVEGADLGLVQDGADTKVLDSFGYTLVLVRNVDAMNFSESDFIV